MSQEWKLVPVELLERLISATKVARGEGSPTQRDAEAILAAAPVPPAGGDAEVLGYQATRLEPTGVARLDRPLLSNVSDWGPAFTVIELVDRAHVTRLQAEVVRLKREEKNDKIAYDAVLQRQNEIRAERDSLKAEVGVRTSQLSMSRAQLGISLRRNEQLQSELTKARELLRGVCESDWSGAKTRHIEGFLAHQSAPAAKTCDYCGGDGYHASPRTPGTTCDACKGTGKDDAPAAKGDSNE